MSSSLNVMLYGLQDSPIAQTLGKAFRQQGASVDQFTGDFMLPRLSFDVLVLLSPQSTAQPTLELGDVAWESNVTYTLTRYFQLIRVLGAQMVEQKHGLILIIGGLQGLTGFPGWAASSVVEGALIALTRSLACEWAESNVRVVFLACGAVESQSLPAAASGKHTLTENSIERTPMKRAATLEEIAQTALYLASDRASFVTGSVIRVDGGWTSWGLLK